MGSLHKLYILQRIQNMIIQKQPLFVLILANSYLYPASGKTYNDTLTCPEGWVDGSSVNMGCLHLHQEQMDWWSAEVLCGYEYNSFMVMIKTMEQMEFLDAV